MFLLAQESSYGDRSVHPIALCGSSVVFQVNLSRGKCLIGPTSLLAVKPVADIQCMSVCISGANEGEGGTYSSSMSESE
jgi:hypothetical protein